MPIWLAHRERMAWHGKLGLVWAVTRGVSRQGRPRRWAALPPWRSTIVARRSRTDTRVTPPTRYRPLDDPVHDDTAERPEWDLPF